MANFKSDHESDISGEVRYNSEDCLQVNSYGDKQYFFK